MLDEILHHRYLLAVDEIRRQRLHVICVVPLETAVTRPSASTVAIEGSLLDHTTGAPSIAAPSLSYTTASSRNYLSDGRQHS